MKRDGLEHAIAELKAGRDVTIEIAPDLTMEVRHVENMTIEARVAHCREEIKGDSEPPDDWPPHRWLNAITYRLGQAAFHAEEFQAAIDNLFPGTSVHAIEELCHDLVVIAAVAMDAVEKLEQQGR
jgi:hypothetical protein